MIEDIIKLMDSREAVLQYLKVNGISGKAKDNLLAKWDLMQNEAQMPEPEPIVVIEESADIEEIDLEED